MPASARKNLRASRHALTPCISMKFVKEPPMTRIVHALLPVAILILGLAANAGAQAVDDAVVQFGPLHPQPAAPLMHRLIPDEVSIHKGGTVLFILNGGGHRVAIYQ